MKNNKQLLKDWAEIFNIELKFKGISTIGTYQKCGDVYRPGYGYFNLDDNYNNDLVNIGDDRFTITGIINYINLKQDIRRVDYEVGV